MSDEHSVDGCRQRPAIERDSRQIREAAVVRVPHVQPAVEQHSLAAHSHKDAALADLLTRT